jgi:type IV pilus assembly protein PilN
MPHINLLPWREELRLRKQKEFGALAGVAVLVMAGVVFAVHLYFQGLIDYQGQRNAFLEAEILKLNKKIDEIKDLENEKERLLARMQIIQQLQSSRPEVVHLMDQLVDTIPEGVYYTKIQQKGRGLNLLGVAQSNARVSSLMRQLDASEWLEDPALQEVKREKAKDSGEDIRLSSFSLNIKQTEQKKPTEDEEAGPAGPKSKRAAARKKSP